MPDNVYTRAAAEQIGLKLRELQEQERVLREQQAAEAEAAKEAERLAKESSLKYQQWIGKEIQRRTVLGGLSPALVSEYLNYSDKPLRDYLDLVQGVLSSPMSGFEVTPTGFAFGGEQMSNVSEMKTKLDTILGAYNDMPLGTGSDRRFGLADGAWLETLLYANLTGSESPVGDAITSNNLLPEGLVGEDQRRMFELTSWHQTLGPLMNSQPQNPDNLSQAEAETALSTGE